LTFFKNTQTFEVEIIKIVAEKNKLSEKKHILLVGEDLNKTEAAYTLTKIK
jgi:hypothetical protein